MSIGNCFSVVVLSDDPTDYVGVSSETVHFLADLGQASVYRERSTVGVFEWRKEVGDLLVKTLCRTHPPIILLVVSELLCSRDDNLYNLLRNAEKLGCFLSVGFHIL